jgi:ATP-dependent Clp protease ATP-binding subunit ClpC
MEEIEKVFRPEFLNRLDDTIIFRHLTKEDLKDVVDLELRKIRERLVDRGFDLVLTEEAKDFLIKKGTNLDFGARPLRRALEGFVEDPLAEEMLQGSFQGMNKIVVEAVADDDGKVRHLKFQGELVETEPEPVAAASSGEAAEEGEETS